MGKFLRSRGDQDQRGPAAVRAGQHDGDAVSQMAEQPAHASDASPRVAAQRALDARLNGSQRMAMQRKQIQDLSTGPAQLQSAGQGVVQRRFDAGVGSGWHIHYGDHVKYASTNATRVNFSGRTRQQIGYQWEQVIQENGLAGTKGDADFIECKTWIRDNIN